jgi:hypothetical protein
MRQTKMVQVVLEVIKCGEKSDKKSKCKDFEKRKETGAFLSTDA